MFSLTIAALVRPLAMPALHFHNSNMIVSVSCRDELLTTTYLRTKDDMLSEVLRNGHATAYPTDAFSRSQVHGLICDSYKQIYDSCIKFDQSNSGCCCVCLRRCDRVCD